MRQSPPSSVPSEATIQYHNIIFPCSFFTRTYRQKSMAAVAAADDAGSIPAAKANAGVPKLMRTEEEEEEEEEEEAKEEEHAPVVDQAGDGSDQEKAPRFPRWTRQEILVLIEGKRVEESKGRKSRVVDDGGRVNTESKWSSISSYCKRRGVNREPVQCRKRWSTLSRDYKKIRDWEARHGDQSFWLLRNDVRRETKLPGFFDRELYNILDKSIIGKQQQQQQQQQQQGGFGKDAVGMPEPVFDSGRSAVEEGLFSDFEHSAQEEVAGTPEKEILESPSTTPPGVGPDKLPTSNGEKVSASSGAGQKRRRVSSEGDSDGDLRHQLLSILERNGRALTAHVEAHNLNCQLDRNQRSEHAESLVGVLGKLADALGRIADKLQ